MRRRSTAPGEWSTETLAAPELAEAASRAGDSAALAEISAWVRARAAATPTEWALGISALDEALDADDDDAEGFYRKSIEHLGTTPLRVALARSHLLYGEWLRRRDRRGDARDQLEIAHDAMSEMGIGAFAERARRELSAATGRRARRYVDASSLQLTAQEQQIAQLVKHGLSNREIGGRPGMSLRELMLADLERGLRIVRDGHEIVPAWRIITPEGDFLILTRFDPNKNGRRTRPQGLGCAGRPASGRCQWWGAGMRSIEAGPQEPRG